MKTRLNRLLATAFLTLGVAGYALAEAPKVTVFAAASLTNALQDIGKTYQDTHKTEVVSSFASSSTLARQIEAGAPADIFISADQKWMDYAADKDTIKPETRIPLLENTLVVVAPKQSPQADIVINRDTDWQALLKGGRLAVGDPEHVPAGLYAKEALENLGAWSTLSSKLAPADNVRNALALVERDETPLGIVYGSDAVASKGVKVVGTFPADSHQKVEYPMAIIKGHDNPAVNGFYQYLQGPEAKKIFEQYGFSVKK